MAGRIFRGAKVIINVYDLSPVNAYAYDFGVGAFHSGVEVMGTEYTFGGHETSSTGIFTHAPRQVLQFAMCDMLFDVFELSF
jgi:hypothetical protein